MKFKVCVCKRDEDWALDYHVLEADSPVMALASVHRAGYDEVTEYGVEPADDDEEVTLP